MFKLIKAIIPPKNKLDRNINSIYNRNIKYHSIPWHFQNATIKSPLPSLLAALKSEYEHIITMNYLLICLFGPNQMFEM